MVTQLTKNAIFDFGRKIGRKNVPGSGWRHPRQQNHTKKMFSEQANHELYLAQKIIKIGSRRSEIWFFHVRSKSNIS